MKITLKYIKTNLIAELILVTVIITMFTNCKKFVEVDPPLTRVNGANVYNNDATAIAVLTGMYTNIIRGAITPNFATGTGSFSLMGGLLGDEYGLFGGANSTLSAFYKNALFVNSSANAGADYWNILYDYIYYTNSAIEGIEKSSGGLTESVRNQLLGEAKFMRAFFYFYLTNLYGEVPLVTSTDYTINATMARFSKDRVYEQLVKDLKDAQELLSIDYLDGNLQMYTGAVQRVRPTKWTAAALLARAYLYKGEYSNAEAQASIVINNTGMFSLAALNDVFKKNSKEAIWQLQPVNTGFNTDDARMFVLTSTGFSNNTPVWISTTLLNAFDINDQRRKPGNWMDTLTISGIKYYYPTKYKVYLQNSSITSPSGMSEYLMVMRLSEQYLIRAEARAQLNNIDGSKSDLDLIRMRAGLPGTNASNQAGLLDSILQEKRVELFAEWGHRWFDLKRTGKIDAVMNVITPVKASGSIWQSYQQICPIPFNEILYNSNLTQTPGY